MTNYYEYIQNNTGGSWVCSDAKGICEYVIIEATNAIEANIRAEEIGLYFDGVKIEIDCDCCGDRWDRWDAERYASIVPSILGKPLEDVKRCYHRDSAYVHYLDRTFEKIELAS